MQDILYLEILGCVSDKGFSLDELVLKTKELFAQEGMAGLVNSSPTSSPRATPRPPTTSAGPRTTSSSASASGSAPAGSDQAPPR